MGFWSSVLVMLHMIISMILSFTMSTFTSYTSMIEATHLQVMHLLLLIVKGDVRGHIDDITLYIDEDVDRLAMKCALDTDSTVFSNTQDVFEIMF
jgi:hypothetical protein